MILVILLAEPVSAHHPATPRKDLHAFLQAEPTAAPSMQAEPASG
jgi:hypothetical protein